MSLKMEIENLDVKQNSSHWRTARNKLLPAALWIALVAWVSSCNNGKWNEKRGEPQQTQYVQPVQDNSETIMQVNDIEESKWRKILETEKFDDPEEYIGPVTKNIYEDGSWSIESKNEMGNYEYTEYYPNSNVIKFKNFNYFDGFEYWIFDEKGRILYFDEFASEAFDGADEFDKFDEKWRLIYRWYGNDYRYQYDDENKTVTFIRDYKKYRYVSVYGMNEEGRADEDNLISKKYIGETGMEIDLLDWGLEKLIEDRGLSDVPHVHDYEPLIYNP
jgi:hypothetical protein